MERLVSKSDAADQYNLPNRGIASEIHAEINSISDDSSFIAPWHRALNSKGEVVTRSEAAAELKEIEK